MPVSVGMIEHLQSNVTFLCAIWTMLATDGTRASYCAHTRDLTFDSILYKASPVEPSRFTQTLGVTQANSVELFGVFDDVVAEEDIQGGKWKNAEITFQYVNYLDLTMGSVGMIRGRAGKFTINNGSFTVEVRSLSDLLSQEIGDLTSPVDRNRNLTDLVADLAPYTFARTVTAAPNRRNFTVGGTAQANDYFKYGKATWTSGDNDERSMEIKANVGNVIELQLPMMSDIEIGDTVSLVAGYDGSIDQARDKFNAAINFQGEPTLPGIKGIIKYPE